MQFLAANMGLAVGPERRVISYMGKVAPMHPWEILRAVYYKKDSFETWTCVMQPGFVNGIDPVVRLARGEDQGVWSPNRVVASSRAQSGGGKKEVRVSEGGAGLVWYDKPRKDVPLLQGPLQTLDFDNGQQWPQLRPVPLAIERMGVLRRAANTGGLNVDTDTGKITVDQGKADAEAASAAKPQRYARSLDIGVAVARPALATKVRVVDASGTSGQINEWSAYWDMSTMDHYGARPFIYVTKDFEKDAMNAAMNNTAIARWRGYGEDDGLDRVWLARAWAVSPMREAPKEGEKEPRVDENWDVVFESKTFWNLHYKLKMKLPTQPPPPVPFFTGLVGGIGDAIINQNLALHHDLADRVLATMQEPPEGRFWE